MSVHIMDANNSENVNLDGKTVRRTMKKISVIFSNIMKSLYKILPFFIGIYCYYPVFVRNENSIHPFLDAVYSSLKLYSGTTEGGIPVGGLLQLARFLALAATLSILINAFDKMSSLIRWLKFCQRDSTVVFGDSDYADYLFENLNRRLRIRGEGKKFVKKAARYMLMFSTDVENLEFYDQNQEYLRDKNVYIMLDDISRQNIENHRITVFSIAENCARQYWKNNPVEKSEKIAIIGFGNTGKNILLYGLQVNLIDPGQHFEYHVYGDGAEFRREHTQLDKMTPDEIVFHDDGRYEFAQISDFDRIIICDDKKDNNIVTVSKLIAAAPISGKVYLFAPNGDIITSLFGSGRITCFGTAKEIASIDIILNEKLMEDARGQHERYCQEYGGTPWDKLDCFKRYSNVSSSDYRHTINRLIEKCVPAESIAELEHIRWCRYHYLHNWKYGSVTDSLARTHNCLVPFSELSEEEKVKDVEAIKGEIKL